MLRDDALAFLLTARARTYAAGLGKTEPLLDGSVQFEYADGDWLYRDIYFIGNGVFPGIETVYHRGLPQFGVSYFGDFSGMSEGQADRMLRPALVEYADTTRTHQLVEREYDGFTYRCAGAGDRDTFHGLEEIHAHGERVYWLRYAGGLIGQRPAARAPSGA